MPRIYFHDYIYSTYFKTTVLEDFNILSYNLLLPLHLYDMEALL